MNHQRYTHYTSLVRAAAVGLLLALGAGCGDTADDRQIVPGPHAFSDAGTSSDMSGTVDMNIETPTDAGETDVGVGPGDMGTSTDMGASTDGGTDPPDMNITTGIACPYTDLEPFSGPCDPVENSGCANGMTCIVVGRIVGPDLVLSSTCGSEPEGTLTEGEACGSGIEEKCAPSLQCLTFTNTCRRLCFNDDAYGCAPDQYCRRPSARGWGGLGFCDDTCNL